MNKETPEEMIEKKINIIHKCIDMIVEDNNQFNEFLEKDDNMKYHGINIRHFAALLDNMKRNYCNILSKKYNVKYEKYYHY